VAQTVYHVHEILRSLERHGGRAPVETDRRGRAFIPSPDGSEWGHGRVSEQHLNDCIEAGLLVRDGDSVHLSEDHPQVVDIADLAAKTLGISRRRASQLVKERRILIGGELPPHALYESGGLYTSHTSISWVREHPDIEALDFSTEVVAGLEAIDQIRRQLAEAHTQAAEKFDLAAIAHIAALGQRLAKASLRTSQLMHQQAPEIEARHRAALAADQNAEPSRRAREAFEAERERRRAEYEAQRPR
jgi:hypothetical protein